MGHSFASLEPLIVAEVLDYLTLRDAIQASYVNKASRRIVLKYLSERYNLSQYLSVFKDPKSLLATFRRTGAILSGSRALAYFLPSIRPFTESSDWDIYVSFPHQETLHKELGKQAFLPIPRSKAQPKPSEFKVYNFRNDCGNVKVQLVVLEPGRSLYQCMMGFHLSIVQNCISGWGCYSMYWGSTLERRGWMAERLDGFPEYQTEMVEKYGVRGIRLVPWAERERTNGVVYAVSWGRRMGDLERYITFGEFKKELQNE